MFFMRFLRCLVAFVSFVKIDVSYSLKGDVSNMIGKIIFKGWPKAICLATVT